MSDSLLISDPPEPGYSPDSIMLAAVRLARQAKWRVAPNPMVGAVLVQGGEIKSSGWHKQYGGPHAEVECLADARSRGVDPSRCELWVTLEPCNHTGKTPPCTRAILEAGIKRVVIGALDPNPAVAGGGADMLRQNGVHVEVGVAEEACLDLLSDFKAWISGRTAVILKLAATLDGKIATRSGHSRWISCLESREQVHHLRRKVQAVLIGGNTFYADDPLLTPRLGGEGGDRGNPIAVVATSRPPRMEAPFRLLKQRPQETLFWMPESVALSEAAKALRSLGCRVWGLPVSPSSGMDLSQGLVRLHQELGHMHLLCEGGGALGLSMLEHGLVDAFHLFMAPKVVGDQDAPGLFTGRSITRMDEAMGLRLAEQRRVGDDSLMVFRPLQEG